MEAIQKIQDIVKLTIGMDLEKIGGSPLARVLKDRMAELGLADQTSYSELLRQSAKEMEALVERIVVPETWFFRNEKPFACLQNYMREEWLPSSPTSPIKIVSLPCSSGEEPYTIAMAMLDIGITPEQLRIEAFDISKCAVEKARKGIYCLNSFRSRDLGFRDRYFRLEEGGYVLDDKVRRCVSFAQGNILAPGFADGKGPYNIVFFRNLLIYMAPSQQEEAMAVIDKLLTPTGVLFVGHAESLQALNRGYTPIPYPFGFSYRKSSHSKQQKPSAPVNAVQSQQDGKQAVKVSVRPTPYSPPKPMNTLSALQSPPDLLATAFALADQGRTKEARKLCQSVIESHTPQADAYYLLGLLLDSEGLAAESESCLRKAVYLKPDHVRALAHLALTAEWRGDAKAAELLRERVRRVESSQTGQ